jgi:hypothetical protein
VSPPAASSSSIMAPVHADEVDRAVGAEGREVLGSLAEKGSEGRLVHLPRGHRKWAMVDGAEAAHMAVDRHVEGRVAEDHTSALPAHQGYKIGRVEGIAAQDSMGSKEP